MNNANKNLLKVVAQAFYGNRTETEVKLENLDRFILGYIDNSIPITEQTDRTVVNINADIVVVYNKYQEEKKRDLKREPLVIVPEKNIKIYSRCVVCRINKNGKLESLKDGDYDKFKEYLAE